MDADPTDHGHQKLKQRKNAGDKTDLALFHAGLVQTVRQGDREGIHGKTDAKQNAVKEKYKIPHTQTSFLKNKKVPSTGMRA